MITKEQLIDILQRFVTRGQEVISQYKSLETVNLKTEEEIYNDVVTDFFNIVNIDLKILKKLILRFFISSDDGSQMISDLKVIIKLLKLSSHGDVATILSEEQMTTLNKFLINLKKDLDNNYEFINKQYDLDEINKEVKVSKKIIKALLDSNNSTFITDTFLLNSVFKALDISTEEMTDILKFILKYNRQIYDYKMGNCNIKTLTLLGKTNISELKDIFSRFGFDFESFSVKVKDNIMQFANVSNIENVLRSLKKNGYDVKDEYLLMGLIIGSDELTIDRISSLAFARGLLPDEVLKIGSILIKQSCNRVKSSLIHDRFLIFNFIDPNLYVFGASDDFEKNIKELSKWGISVRYVYERAPQVLCSSNIVLAHNLALFQEYGFSLKTKTNKLSSPVISMLMNYTTYQIIDRFIEVHPLGIEYLRENLSILKQIKRLDDLVFYKLYYSSKNDKDNSAFMLIVDSNSYLCMQGKVSGLSSIYYDSYASINEDNKYVITKAYTPVYTRDYYALVKNEIDHDIDARVFDSPYIQHINKYSDKKEALVYDFDGIRISKLKVLRIFDALLNAGILLDDESFLFAVLFNTIISQEDYEKVKSMISLEG